jgi:hypothetical protein
LTAFHQPFPMITQSPPAFATSLISHLLSWRHPVRRPNHPE